MDSVLKRKPNISYHHSQMEVELIGEQNPVLLDSRGRMAPLQVAEGAVVTGSSKSHIYFKYSAGT